MWELNSILHPKQIPHWPHPSLSQVSGAPRTWRILWMWDWHFQCESSPTLRTIWSMCKNSGLEGATRDEQLIVKVLPFRPSLLERKNQAGTHQSHSHRWAWTQDWLARAMAPGNEVMSHEALSRRRIQQCQGQKAEPREQAQGRKGLPIGHMVRQ